MRSNLADVFVIIGCSLLIGALVLATGHLLSWSEDSDSTTASEPESCTMEQCRMECSEIVADLRAANDDLWERWLACSQPTNAEETE